MIWVVSIFHKTSSIIVSNLSTCESDKTFISINSMDGCNNFDKLDNLFFVLLLKIKHSLKLKW